MSEPVATLIVDWYPENWLQDGGGTVRISGDLPTVLELGDRVTLAHQHGLPDSVYGGPPSGTIKFATATVAKIDTVREHLGRDDDIFVTVTDVEES